MLHLQRNEINLEPLDCHETIDLLAILKKRQDRASYFIHVISDVQSSSVRASISIVHIRKSIFENQYSKINIRKSIFKNLTTFSKIRFDSDSFQNS